MGRVARYAAWRRRPLGAAVEPDGLDRERARAIVDAAVATTGGDRDGRDGRDGDQGSDDGAGHDDGAGSGGEEGLSGGRWLTADEAEGILTAYGVPLAGSRVVTTAREAGQAQREFDAPVAVKVAAAIHKADVGGVELGLSSPKEAAAAVERITASLTEAGLAEHTGQFLVQEMVGKGVEMVVGVTHDPSFGPIVLTGMGGTLVELLGDVSVRITPLTDRDVDEMLEDLRMAPLLRGYRGDPPADVPALRDLLFRINAMVEDLPEVAELDLNPVFVREDGHGVVAVDVRLKLVPVR
jgi:acyl-CoA synthetase (NDP forming)